MIGIMIADLSIFPVGGDTHISGLLGEVLKEIKASGLDYQLTPTATCLEGTWDEITSVARRCHQVARRDSPHVITLLRIEDDADEGATKLRRNVSSVEEKAGQPLQKEATADVQVRA